MKKHTILQTLQSGICEITYTDDFSVEFTMIGTLAQTHLPHDCDTMDIPNDSNTFTVFNVNTEKWQTLSVHSVNDIEQLTGEGAAVNESKLQASPEFMEQLELFTEQEFDSLEHPDDSGVSGDKE
jgi:hypothetical protein